MISIARAHVFQAITIVALVVALGWSRAEAGPVWATRDAAVLIEALKIAEPGAQRTVELLLEDYDRDWQAAHGHMLEAQAALIDDVSPGDEHMHALLALSIDLAATESRLEAALESGLFVMLSQDQRARWPAVRGEVHRARALPLGTLRGERVDLLEMVATFDQSDALTDVPGVTQRTDLWITQIEHALQERSRFDRTGGVTFRLLMGTGQYEDALDHAQAMLHARQAVRDTTDRAIADIVVMTPEPLSASFLTHAVEFENGGPDKPRLSQFADRLREDPSLDPRQIEQLDAVMRDWRVRREPLTAEARWLNRRAEGLQRLSTLQRRLNLTVTLDQWTPAITQNTLAIMGLDNQTRDALCAIAGSAACARARHGGGAGGPLADPDGTKPEDSPFPTIDPHAPAQPSPFPEVDPNAPPEPSPFPEPDPGAPTRPSPFPEPDPDTPSKPDPFPEPDPDEPTGPSPFPEPG